LTALDVALATISRPVLPGILSPVPDTGGSLCMPISMDAPADAGRRRRAIAMHIANKTATDRKDRRRGMSTKRSRKALVAASAGSCKPAPQTKGVSHGPSCKRR
jgi:hypothetical protein